MQSNHSFAPIAIVGRSCLLPGVHSPAQLWQAVVTKRDLLSVAPEGRWRMPKAEVLCAPSADAQDHAWSDRGGYVEGFEQLFDASGFAIPKAEIEALDPLFQWGLHTAREALQDAGCLGTSASTGAIFGNLSFPSASLSRWVESQWLQTDPAFRPMMEAIGLQPPDPRNRFSSGLPALLMQRALGLSAGGFALDAACASSLYAIKLACDRLHQGRADIMLAGAVNCTDDLFIHVGFCALQALSRTGQSRPFHAQADGLVPGEGAGFVVLKRLEDAVRAGDTIYGVIRAVGISNDGRSKGLLAPSSGGQVRALMQAYKRAGLSPSQISLLECHATGTPVGDATEVKTMTELFAPALAERARGSSIPVGSLKSNMGHLITAAGIAGVLKVTEAMRTETLPPMLHLQEQPASLQNTPFRAILEPQPWDCDGVRRAGISAFGFGGNNAHLILEQYSPDAQEQHRSSVPVSRSSARDDIPVAIVGIGIKAAKADNRRAFQEALWALEPVFPGMQQAPNTPTEVNAGRSTMRDLSVSLEGLKFPPKDLEQTLGQQIAILEAAREALVGIEGLDSDETGVFVGMGVDTAIPRYGMRWRLRDWAKQWNASADWLQAAQEQTVPGLQAAGVVGTMPNIPANRINSQFDFAGAGFSVSAEEHSGFVALDIAIRALQEGELSAALVGAVDLSCEWSHIEAVKALLPADRQHPGDAAVVLVLKRLPDAQRHNDRIFALLERPVLSPVAKDLSPSAASSSTNASSSSLHLGLAAEATSLNPQFGHAHAASALVHTAAAALSLHHCTLPGGEPWLAHVERKADVSITSMEGQLQHISLKQANGAGASPEPPLRLFVFSGASDAEVIARMESGQESNEGPMRLALVASSHEELEQRKQRARQAILQGAPGGEGVHFRRSPMQGELGFVFAGAGAAYHGMGRELLTAFPGLGQSLSQRFSVFPEVLSWAFATPPREPSVLDKLWGASAICQLHAELSWRVLGLQPAAAIGYSSGESNSLFATGVWRDVDAMIRESHESGMFTRELSGEFQALRRAWGVDAHWAVWTVLAPVEEVEAAIANEPRVRLTILHSAQDCMIGGEAEACERIVQHFGKQRCHRLHYDMVVHAPEIIECKEAWLALHRRKVHPTPVRIYSNASHSHYTPTTEACAQAIYKQADQTLCFPPTILQAWNDGVRIFLEHGPQGACSRWIRDILGDREAVVVSFDRKGKGVRQVYEAAATLIAAGVSFDYSALQSPMSLFKAPKPTSMRTFPAHFSAIQLPPLAQAPRQRDSHRSQDIKSSIEAVKTPVGAKHMSPHTDQPSVERYQVVPQAQLHAPVMEPYRDMSSSTNAHRSQENERRIQTTEKAVGAKNLSPPNAIQPLVFEQKPQWMPPAPWLPPVSEGAPQTNPELHRESSEPSGQMVTSSHLLPRHEVYVVPTHEAGPMAQYDDPILAHWQYFHAQVSQLHQHYLAQQAAIHQQFLQTRQRQLGVLHQVSAFEAEAQQPAYPQPTYPQPPAIAPAPPVAPAPVLQTPVKPSIPTPTQPTPPVVHRNGVHKHISPATTTPSAPAVLPQKPATSAVSSTVKPTPPSTAQAVSSRGQEAQMPVVAKDSSPHTDKPSLGDSKQPSGLKLNRAQLEIHASGRISEIFGPLFAQQDGYERQVRMPEPPLLLADRVTGIDAVAGSMGKGTLWTETDVCKDSWYLHDGYMPAGIMIESGQADLMLISYLGIDFLNKSERIYRLLGCELTFHGNLPTVGETLVYDIHVDGHARTGAVRLFFFHYDCHINGTSRLTVRQGQAGFFTDEELKNSAGILWTPEESELDASPRLDPPVVPEVPSSFARAQIEACAEGRIWDCFGEGFGWAKTHTRTPHIQSGEMLFLERITSFLPHTGGPWKRGYLKAETEIHADDWFFRGHFKNDPCMPGTLMFEGCLQAMAFYMIGMGFTLKRDGWRFQPLPEVPVQMRCRGQVTPTSKHLTYEVFVHEVSDGPVPTLVADLLCTVDGLKAFHAQRMGLQLVPDWPMTSLQEPPQESKAGLPVAESNGFRFDYPSLLACAWGRPSAAFGPMYEPFDGYRRVARLPGPPYHFMSRISKLSGEMGKFRVGSEVEVQYDIPEDVWYFDANGNRTMPFCVLLEAALQPCGWLASYIGSALTTTRDLSFRNLDGTGTLHRELFSTSGTLVTRSKSTNISNSAGMIIESFEVECFLDDQRVYSMNTVFGFFPEAALASQVGLSTTPEHAALLTKSSDFLVDLTTRPDKYFGGAIVLPQPMLLMIDRVNGFWPEAGEKGLGVMRAEKDVDQGEWFFKAHFFQDPVQPGSLGIEAMLQLLQFYMLEVGMHEGIEAPRFEPVALEQPMTWKYRGQVLPSNQRVYVTIEILHCERATSPNGSAFATAKASLWVDRMRIYEASPVGMRIVSGGPPETKKAEKPEPSDRNDSTGIFVETKDVSPDTDKRYLARDGQVYRTIEHLDPARDSWLKDHCPTWTHPALPMMSMVERLACAVDAQVHGLRNVKVHQWLDFPGPRALFTQVKGKEVLLLASPRGADVSESSALSAQSTDGLEQIASGLVMTGPYATPPAALAPISGQSVETPYETGCLFHGPAFHLVKSLTMGKDGSSTVLDAGLHQVPVGKLHQALLDAATHGIPHDALHLWNERIAPDQVAYPALIPTFDIYGPTPTRGEVRCEVRFDGFFGGVGFPAFLVQMIAEGRVWVQFRLIEACFPKGPIGSAEPLQRRAFLRDKKFVPGLALSRQTNDETRLSQAEVEASDWFPGTMAQIYGTRDVEAIARREAAAQETHIHPGRVFETLPLTEFFHEVKREERDVVVRRTAPAKFDLAPVKDYWTRWFARDPWLVEDLYYGLLRRFVGKVVLEDPDTFAKVRGRSILYLANHQVGIESLLFSILASGLVGAPTVTLAKIEHKTTWLGLLIAECFQFPGITDPKVITFFDRQDKSSLPRIIGELAIEMMELNKSVMVHIEGTRSLTCRTPVEKMSGAFLDMAIQGGVPVVPVRLVGALPVETMEERIEFPIGMGKQDIWLGRPLFPEELASMHYGERKQFVIRAINELGPPNSEEQPSPGDPAFAAKVAQYQKQTGVAHEDAVLMVILQETAQPCHSTQRLLQALQTGVLTLRTDDPEEQWFAGMAKRLLGPHGPILQWKQA